MTRIEPAGEEAEEEALRREGERIEALLEEVSKMAGPQTTARIEELLGRLVRLYGAGLRRVLMHAREAVDKSASLEARLTGDELVSSLLLLHGLHPRSAFDRVADALAKVRPYLGSHAGDVELLDLDDAGVVRLRLLGSCRGCPSSRATIEGTLKRAIFDAAPEVTQIDVEGTDGAAPPLVQLELRRARQRWVRIEATDLAPGTLRAVEGPGLRVLILRVGPNLLAYRDRCAACSAALDTARLEGELLQCASCERRYAVTRGGRTIDGGPFHLEPVPLLVDGRGPRIAMAEAP